MDELLDFGSQGIFFAFRGCGGRESAVELLPRRSADVREKIGQVGGGLKLDLTVVRIIHYGQDIDFVQLRSTDPESPIAVVLKYAHKPSIFTTERA